MKWTLSLLLTFLIIACKSGSEEKAVYELPLTYHAGFGPFGATYGLLAEEYTMDNPGGEGWVPTYRPVKGIPKSWKSVVKSMVWLDGFQLVYQNFHEGKIGKEMYESLQKDWDWEPDTVALSEKPIKCFVYTVRGVDETGKVAVMVDTNNNLDFSDETAFYPEKVFGKDKAMNSDSLRTYRKLWTVQYEHVVNGKVVKDSLPMCVKHAVDYESGMDYWYAFPRYATATLALDGKQHEIAINNMFGRSTFVESTIFDLTSLSKGKRFLFRDGIEKGELLETGSFPGKQKFRNMGINVRTGALVLKSEKADLDEYSLQKGYPFRPFAEKDFKTGKQIALSDFKGKYTLVDFWGTWCKPCVEDLPALRAMYKEADKSRIQFVGIVGLDKGERLNRFLTKNQLEWPQILSDSVNKLVEIYNVQAYPTTVLIGPDGRVVAKDLRGDALRDKLREISAGPAL
jgi:thiol-disulfide isomerase/thioredoxin